MTILRKEVVSAHEMTRNDAGAVRRVARQQMQHRRWLTNDLMSTLEEGEDERILSRQRCSVGDRSGGIEADPRLASVLVSPDSYDVVERQAGRAQGQDGQGREEHHIFNRSTWILTMREVRG